ncbi:type II toxin-antitoxin system death-on-curing family toxin [Alienimonas chondri]|uniref:Fido domain-containing protein n=1 Tax=Alienimonas chondri TaxID=2681879 RepID=A0ABX1VC04_9PLAN|nr:type II toxin-antitoxin system death-on-curing family toxin [Alienimonas chondri]NNJ25040.1 hypothetical protein [Alienimonas chondri]
MERLTLDDLLELHEAILATSGGSTGLRDPGTVHSALSQPFAAFGGKDLYPSLEEKAACICYTIVRGHPFVDGNKRTGHGAAALFLKLNGFELRAEIDDAEATILALAAGTLPREELTVWVRDHAVPHAAD